jgi:hypothetical protein
LKVNATGCYNNQLMLFIGFYVGINLHGRCQLRKPARLPQHKKKFAKPV